MSTQISTDLIASVLAAPRPASDTGHTYQDLSDSSSSRANQRSALNRWLELAPWLNLGRRADDPGRACASLADFVGKEFERVLTELKYATQTVDDRQSSMRFWRERWMALLRSDGLPQEFAGAFSALVRRCGSIRTTARDIGLSREAIRRWMAGETPGFDSLDKIIAFEGYAGVPSGTLLSRLPVNLHGASIVRKNTDYRRHVSEVSRKKYVLGKMTLQLQREWNGLYRFYTDGLWVKRKKLKRIGRGWRVHPKTGRCKTAGIKLGFIKSFMGFLTLPAEPENPAFRDVEFDPQNREHDGARGFDPCVTGKGYARSALTLGLFADTDLIYDYIEFYRGRTHKNVYNYYVRGFLSFCKQLTHPTAGYLTQHYEFAPKVTAFARLGGGNGVTDERKTRGETGHAKERKHKSAGRK
jgi:hypothetical protein